MPTRDLGTRRRLIDRPILPGLLAGGLAVLYSAALAIRTHGDVSVLVHAAPPWTDAAQSAPSLTVGAAGTGFDGQFFYRLAVAPFSSAPTAGGVTFDLPALRAVRWGYGALTWLLSGGQPAAVPWVLVIVNVVAMTAIGWSGGGLARGLGRPAITGLMFPLWPGFAYSLSLDTAELVSGAFLLGGLLAVSGTRPGGSMGRVELARRGWLGAALLSAAVLSRDTAVVAAVGLAIGAAWSRRRPALLAGSVAVAVFIGWQLLTWARFGALPLTASAGNNITAPLVEMLRAFRAVVPPHGSTGALRLVSLLTVLALIVVPAIELRRSAAGLGEKVSWAFGVLVVLLLAAPVWAGATSFMRGATEMGLFAMLILLGSRHRPASLTLAVPAVLWVITVAAQLTKLSAG